MSDNIIQMVVAFTNSSQTKKIFFKVGRLPIIPMTGRDRAICMCTYHENLSMLLSWIGKVFSTIPISPEDIVKYSTCGFDDDYISCIDRESASCEIVKYVENIIPGSAEMADAAVNYFRRATNESGYAIKKAITTDIARAKEDLIWQLDLFARHVYNSNKQHGEMKYPKDNLKSDEVLLQVNFAENYSIKHQNEIMSTH